MKLRTLAIAVAVASMPIAAQADLKISGDIGVGYGQSRNNGSEGAMNPYGSEINFDASDKVGGITYMGHVEIELTRNGQVLGTLADGTEINGGGIAADELRVGAKGAFGEVWIGDADNGCNQLDINSDQTWFTGQNGASCKGNGDGLIVYKRGIGPVTAAISHHPGSEQTAIGVKGKVGKFGLSAGYEDLNGGDNIVLGAQAGFGPVTAYLDWNSQSSDTAGVADVDNWGLNLYYSRGINAYIGVGENNDVGYTEAGIGKTIGKTDFIFEVSENDGAATSETGYAAVVRHRF